MKIEFLPDDKFLLKTNIDKDADTRPVSDFISGLLTRELIDDFMEALYDSITKNNAEPIANNICANIITTIKDTRLIPNLYGRNSLVRPSDVMKQFTSGDSNE